MRTRRTIADGPARQTDDVPVDDAQAPWLTDDDRERYEWHRHDLLRRVKWEAARGIELTEQMIDTVAAHAALLVAGYRAE